LIEENKTMRILVTGIAGFIGSHTAERFLDLGHDVIGIDNFCDYYSLELKRLNANTVENKGAKIITMDLREADAYDTLPTNIDYIFHFAAQPGISSTSTFEDYASNNIIGTKNVIDYALKCSDLKLFVNHF
jgi:nucleoside-diphosphate-sugar epimerase